MPKKEKVVNLMGTKVPEEKLLGALKDVVSRRGIKATLILEHQDAALAPPEFENGGEPYYNVYRYAFWT